MRVRNLRVSLSLTTLAGLCAFTALSAPQHTSTSVEQRRTVLTAAASPRMAEEPWRLDLESRLKRRFNDGARIERLRADGIVSEQSSRQNVVDGSKNPELLLPWELYEFLTSTAFYKDPSVASAWRSRYANASSHLKVDSEFWRRLEKASAPYLDAQRQLASLSDRMMSSNRTERGRTVETAAAIESRQCRNRMIALQQANVTFGAESFAEFLYVAVAPNVKISSLTPTTAEQHRRISGGCQ